MKYFSGITAPNCKQVNLPWFAGNRHDATTVEEMVEAIEKKHGNASRVWVMERGMTSEDNVEFLQQEGRRYTVGTTQRAC